MKGPCGDAYCDDCLESLYWKCMKDETLFPPRCCQKEFPWALARHHLSQQCRSKFGQKRKELETKDRTYCHRPQCSAFIDPATFDQYEWAACRICGASTCQYCKQAAHYGRCQEDRTLTALMNTAHREGWQRCYACRQMVELKHGCNHMTLVFSSRPETLTDTSSLTGAPARVSSATSARLLGRPATVSSGTKTGC